MPFYEDSSETFFASSFHSFKALMGEVKGVSKEVISSLRFPPKRFVKSPSDSESSPEEEQPELVLRRRNSDDYKRAFMSVL
jgi:hypothetical protein